MAKAVEKKTSTSKTPAPAEKKAAPSAAAPKETKSWHTVGQAGFDRKHQQDKLAEARREKGVPRFYLKHTPGDRGEDGPKDNESRVVFLDSAGFWVFEHNLKIDGKWGNFCTCTKDFQPCEVCSQLGDKPVYTCYFSVIDTRRWPKKDGTISKPRRVLFPAKGSAIEVIEKLKAKHGDLRGLVVDVSRIGDRDPNCGRDFDVVLTKDGKVARIDPAKRFPEGDDAKPFDYMKVLAPPTPDELKGFGVTASVSVGSEDDMDEDVVPASKSGLKGRKVAEPDDDELDDLVGD